MKVPLKILWIKEATSTKAKGIELLKKEYKILATFVNQRTVFQEVLRRAHSFDLVLIQLPLSNLYKTTILELLKEAILKTVCIVIDVATNTEKIDWIKAGARECVFANEIELLPTFVEQEFQRSTPKAETCLELKEKKINYEALFHNNPEAILIHDFHEIIQVNAAFLAQLGYLNAAELLGRVPLETIVHPEDVALLELTQEGQGSKAMLRVPNIRLLKKDNSILRCDLKLSTIEWDAACYIQITLQQIDNQVYLAKKKQSQMLLQHAEQVPGVIYQFQMFPDGSYCFPFVSTGIYKTHGITAQELMEDGTKYFDYIPEEDIKMLEKVGSVSRDRLENWSADYRLVIPNMGTRWMRGTSTPVRMPDGSTLWYGYIADITNDKIASAALKDREEQVRTIFKYAPDAIVVLETDSTIVEWNPKAIAIFGWTEEEAVGKQLYELIAPKRKHYKYKRSLERYKNKGNGITLNQALEVRAVRKNGEEFSITMALSEMTLRGSDFFIGFISDITKRKNAAEKLKESLVEKEVLLKEIHHRVKNNMQVITSLLSLQSSFIEDNTVKEIFKKSQYRINSMGMVHEMLYQSEDISKIDYGLYLRRLVEGLIRAMKGDESAIQLDLSVPSISLNIDTAIPLGLIVNELVTNALKYAFPNEQKGTIFVKLSCLEYPKFQLEIGDDGIGFFSEDILKTTNSLGLMLVRRLAIQLKGSIRHLNSPKGTYYELLFQEVFQF